MSSSGPSSPPPHIARESDAAHLMAGDGAASARIEVARPVGSTNAIMQVLMIAFVVLLGYGIAPERLPLMGEETCRALHGIEMAQSGDWLVATNQGVPILDRPPMQYWSLALVHRFVHPLDPKTLRWSMVVITLGTSLLVFWYARRFLSPTGALCAAVAYPTMGHVLDLGLRVEADGLFTLLLAGALLTWHAGHDRDRGRALIWSVASALAAMATLTKGLQGPVAFFGATGAYLVLRREWRAFVSPAALCGVAIFLGMIAIWQIPFHQVAGWEGTRSTWFAPGGQRLSAEPAALLKQLATFPLEAIVATLPWSPLLLGLLDPRFWAASARFRSTIIFLLLASAAIFVPVWISAGGHHRYIMPMYPLVAVLCGAVVHRALSLTAAFSLRRFWRDYVRILSVVFMLVAIALAVATLGAAFDVDPRLAAVAQPWWLVALLLAASLGSVLLLIARTGRNGSVASVPRSSRFDPALAPSLLATLVALFHVGPFTNVRIARSESIGPAVVALRESLGPEEKLVSFGRVHHKFLYWYGEAIPIIPKPASVSDIPEDVVVFAATLDRGQSLDLPFPWTRIAELSMDRTRNDDPERRVVVGRRTM